MVEKSNSNFKSALKGTTLLGGVQVFKILIAVLLLYCWLQLFLE